MNTRQEDEEALLLNISTQFHASWAAFVDKVYSVLDLVRSAFLAVERFAVLAHQPPPGMQGTVVTSLDVANETGRATPPAATNTQVTLKSAFGPHNVQSTHSSVLSTGATVQQQEGRAPGSGPGQHNRQSEAPRAGES
jgi:hypothetical protein